MKITDTLYFGGAEEKISRLAIQAFPQLLEMLEGIEVNILEERNANGGACLRELIDSALEVLGGWTISKSGDIDWRRCHTVGETQVCIGVEIQVSARSDLIFRDIIHIRRAIEDGSIDIGVIVVPNAKLAEYLTDRCPNLRETERAIREDMRVDKLPLVVVALEHDGPSRVPLPKKKRKS